VLGGSPQGIDRAVGGSRRTAALSSAELLQPQLHVLDKARQDKVRVVDGLAEAEAAIPRTSHHYLVDPPKAKGAATRGAGKRRKKNAHGGGWVLFLGVAGSEKHTFVFFAPWPHELLLAVSCVLCAVRVHK
jgi:hypothetical protein